MSLSTLASLGMAVGAPLVYADQAYSIYRKQDATGFSHDVCAVLLIANITRCFFWLGEYFEFALLLQSVLMIASQLFLLHLCLRFKPITSSSRSISSSGSRVIFESRHSIQQDTEEDSLSFTAPRPTDSAHHAADDDEQGEDDGISYPDKKPLLASLGLQRLNLPFLGRGAGSRYGMVSSRDEDAISSQNRAQSGATSTAAATEQGTASRTARKKGGRPIDFWQWEDYGSYILFLGLYVLLLSILQLALGWTKGYVSALGFFALGLESTLPIPQLVANQKRRSLAGFRTSVLVGWLGGDSFKLIYFLLRLSPLQFTICALFQLSIDGLILLQSIVFLEKTKSDQEEMKNKEETRRAQRGEVDFVDVEHARAGMNDEGGDGVGARQTVEPDEDEGDLGRTSLRK